MLGHAGIISHCIWFIARESISMFHRPVKKEAENLFQDCTFQEVQYVKTDKQTDYHQYARDFISLWLTQQNKGSIIGLWCMPWSIKQNKLSAHIKKRKKIANTPLTHWKQENKTFNNWKQLIKLSKWHKKTENQYKCVQLNRGHSTELT